jgi:predicted Zn-dependent protease
VPGAASDGILGQEAEVANADLYAPGMNFVFGLADSDGRRAVISLARLRPEFYGSPPAERR